MNDEEIRTTIVRVLADIAPEANLDAIEPDVPFQEQLDLDSMDFLNLVTGLAEETGVEIPERDYPRMSTLTACFEYLRSAATPHT
jgi:acyl carrier protein